MEHRITQGESVEFLRQAIFEELLDSYQNDPESIPEEIRRLIETYIGQTEDPYQ